MASGHDFLCAESPEKAQLEQLLVEMANVGEAFRLALKLLACFIAEISQQSEGEEGDSKALEKLRFLDGFCGVPWWETTGFNAELIPEAISTTGNVLQLLRKILPLPKTFDTDDLASLVGRVRMNLGLKRWSPTRNGSMSKAKCPEHL